MTSRIDQNLPYPTYSTFVGMTEELSALRRLLSPTSRYFMITIDGVGGAGKSALALETANHYLREYDRLPEEERFDAIIWTSAKISILTADGAIPRPRAARTLEDIYTTISVVLHREDITRAHFSEQDELVKRALAQQRTLLIVDNLETIDDERVNAFLRELPAPTKVIVTTRHRIDVAYPVRLAGMPETEGLALIAHECEERGVTLTKEEASKLYRRTGGVPLAIVWSVARVGYGFEIEEVLRQLGQPTGDIARFCFDGMIERIQGTDAHNLMMALALFETDASRESVGHVAGFDTDNLSRDEGLVRLERLSLVNKRWHRFSMLPLTKVFVEDELRKVVGFSSQARERWVEWAVGLMECSSPLGSLDESGHDVLKQEYKNILGVIDWCHLNKQWLELTKLASHLCLFLYRQGLWQELTDTVDQGLTACERIGDLERQAWLYLYSALVHIYQGELDRAQIQLSEVARILTRMDKVPDQLRESYMYRQSTLARRRDGSASEKAIERQYSLARKMGDAWRMVSALSRLAESALDTEQFALSDQYLQQALRLAEGLNDNNLLVRVLTGMITSARKRGYLDQAKAICERATDIMSRTASPIEPWANAYLAVEKAQVHKARGEREEALHLARTALDIFSRLEMENEVIKCRAFWESIEGEPE